MKINDKLKEYIEENIFPEYSKNEPAHNIDHIKYVINRSFKFADTIPNINYDMVYTIASYHDIGHHVNPKIHEIVSAEIMYNDNMLKEFFNDEERKIIKEAIEDHRASSNHEPRNIYGKICWKYRRIGYTVFSMLCWWEFNRNDSNAKRKNIRTNYRRICNR